MPEMSVVGHLTSKTTILKVLLLLLGGFYIYGSMLPKHWDYWTITNISLSFAVDPLHFLTETKDITFPPTFYALQGAWLWFGSHLFHYDLAIRFNPDRLHFWRTSLGSVFPFWGMVPLLAPLFLLVGLAYKGLRNQWLTLMCFGPITFVSVIMYGQIDVVVVLFIFISMLLLQRALNAEKSVFLLLLGYLALGVSLQFKTYGGLLLPVYVIYTIALIRTRTHDRVKILLVLGSCLATCLVATLIIWLPYLESFGPVMLHGESNWLVQKPSPLFQVPIWLPGYVLMLSYIALRVLKNSLNALQDRRYFAIDTFAIVVWFFIAVWTFVQWWMFLVPAALLVLDSFRSKRSLVFCISVFIVYFFYVMLWWKGPMIKGFVSYNIPTLIYTTNRFLWSFTLLVGLLLFWLISLYIELRDDKPDYITR